MPGQSYNMMISDISFIMYIKGFLDHYSENSIICFKIFPIWEKSKQMEQICLVQ